MGDVIDVSYRNGDVIVITLRGSLADEVSPSDQLIKIARNFTDHHRRSRYVLILDLSEMASLDNSDVTIIERAEASISRMGGLLVIADPEIPYRYPSPRVRTFDSVTSAISKTSKELSSVPVQIYLDNESTSGEVELALEMALREFGVTRLGGPPPIYGSWYRHLTGWVRRAGASQAGVDLARALEIQLLDRYQAGIDDATSDAVARLVTALEKTSGAVIQAGSVLLVKYDDTVVVRQLTQQELLHWHRNPSLFKDPRRALAELQRAAHTPDASGFLSGYSDETEF